ncbi:hypothetical protein BDN70DRAFT_895763 [Pholiota conissans]|uniref:Heterokaryon incompatibility domain-containing protein n=1 Tax=Pholiota conissans TaxID=109636 RepID=A0A9P5YZA6_9AGAR|nr:hypothetical protein BDN70DRAFT_895763 [Pholiota conissans]
MRWQASYHSVCNINLSSEMSADHQDLLTAFQDFIVLLIQCIKGKNAVEHVQFGNESGRLVGALHEFILNIVQTHTQRIQNSQTTREVSLTQEETATDSHLFAEEGTNFYVDSVGQSIDTLSEVSEEYLSESDSGLELDEAVILGPLDEPQFVFHKALQTSLREHIFNKLPIRLLFFEPQKTCLQISLRERGAICEHFSDFMRAKMLNPEFRPISQPVWYPKPSETSGQAIERLIVKYVKYAILSHTWLRRTPEVTYGDWPKGSFDLDDPGYQKLVNFCKIAWKDHDVSFGWMDTICINKESSSELDESIRSMYNWYRRANVCITYLAETDSVAEMHTDPWFTRGWTLQELLAPEFIRFYDRRWNQLVEGSENDKWDNQIRHQIKLATTLSPNELMNSVYIHAVPISRKMQLAATRQVTREEDTAYSLMGIFQVSFSTAYGEGAERAFSRLLQAILNSTEYVLDIFNWAGEFWRESQITRLLPSNPKFYLHRLSTEFLTSQLAPMEPLTLTHLGLRIPIILMPGISLDDTLKYDPISDYATMVTISPTKFNQDIPTTYGLLDKKIYQSPRGDGRIEDQDRCYQMTFAVFNFFAKQTHILLPHTCVAKGLHCTETPGNVTTSGQIFIEHTSVPIIFNLRRITKPPQIRAEEHNHDESSVDNLDAEKISEMDIGAVKEKGVACYNLEKNELIKQGMQLVILYL